ncbi:MAG: GxxExxY protein, partial [Candidatus Ryanbacteria bacterium]|nr:GxxExxY protein [Candidatus Ryanbacteria bacterium]
NKNISKIKAIAKDVYKVLGSGVTESVYDKAMQVGLRSAKIRYDSQKVVELLYKDHYVGEGYLDLIAHVGTERILVELKAVSGELGAAEDTQIRNYMRRLKIKHGLLINFQQPGKKEGKAQLEFKEVNL